RLKEVGYESVQQYEGDPEAEYDRSQVYAKVKKEFNNIIEACDRELDRSESSNFKKYNNDFFEQAVFNDTYRNKIFSEIFDMELDKFSKAKKYLKRFSEVANDHFTENDFLKPRYAFFQEFFTKENIKQAEWTDFQEIGENV